MAIVTGIVHTVSLPHEPGESVVIRRLGSRVLEDAAEIQMKRQLGRVRDMGGFAAVAPQVIGEDQEATARKAVADAAQAEPHTQLDRRTLLIKGIVSWSYPQPLTVEKIDDLDEVTADLLHKEIAAFSRPKSEADAKNS